MSAARLATMRVAMASAMLKHKNAHQVHQQTKHSHQQKTVRVHVRRIDKTFQCLLQDEQCDENQEQSVDEAAQHFSALVAEKARS